MESELKRTLKAVTLELRHLLEGRYEQSGQWKPGDLEQRLAAIGVRRDRASVPVDELGHLVAEDRHARKVVDAYLKLRDEAGVDRTEAVAELVRETAYTWANRLLALRCMEARELIDPVILQQEAYGGRSLEHHRLAQRHPELCAGDDDGLFAVLDKVFRAQAGRLPMLFDPQAPGIALRPSAAALKDCFGLLSLNPDTLRNYRIRLTDDETARPGAEQPNPFTAPDALGWAYQYWNTEEKKRVFEALRTVRGAKIAGADIIPATQLYTEDYMVRFLVQNSLGATWMGMYPESKLSENWEYYVKNADRATIEKKPVSQITFLDPACGSGHFHLAAFDLFYAMYQEEGELTAPEEICNAILTKNLFGIDIDPRAVQIAEVALWMKAAERAFDYKGVPTNLIAATASHLKGEAWEEFLADFEREPSVGRVLRQFAHAMEHIDEIGSLAHPAEDLRKVTKEEHATWERQVREKKEANYLFPEMNDAALAGQLLFQEISDEEFGDRLFYRAKAGIDAFTERARTSGEFADQILGSETRTGFRLADLLSRKYTVVAANPPYASFRNVGPFLSSFLRDNYPSAPTDTYSAFVWRALDLLDEHGRIAFVTQDGLLLLPSISGLRDRILRHFHLEVVVHLGPRAFEDISGEKVSVALSIIHSASPSGNTKWFCLVNSDSKPQRLIESAQQGEHAITNDLDSSDYLTLPTKQWLYFAPRQLVNTIAAERTLESVSLVRQGIITGANGRFVRFWWELPEVGGRWKWYFFGSDDIELGACGLPIHAIDWRCGNTWRFIRPRSSDLHFKEGITFGRLGKKFVCTRLPAIALFDVNASGAVFLSGSFQADILAYVSAPLVAALLKALNVSLTFLIGDVGRVPLPESVALGKHEQLRNLGIQLLELRRQRAISDPRCPRFNCWSDVQPQREDAILSQIDRCVQRELGLTDEESLVIRTVADVAATAFENESEDENDGEQVEVTAIEDSDQWTTIIHSVATEMGFSWHPTDDPNGPVPESSDKVGIATVTDTGLELTIGQRLRAREKQRAGIRLGNVDLDDWLRRDLFALLCRLTLKRPFLWHLESKADRSRGGPAFACFVLARSVDRDTLEKLRTQYVGPFRQRLETEHRGILLVAQEARNERQEKRRGELEDSIVELQRFDATLQAVAETGFGPSLLISALRQYAIDDGMLALKGRWLRRLTELIAKSPLPDWLAAAERTELHREFRTWIADAMAHLDYFCARVGPKSPDQAKLTSDPTATDLAKLIAPRAKELLMDTLELACDKWYAEFDEIVLGPDKDKIKKLREEQYSCEEQLEAGLDPEATEIRQLKYRVKEIKADVKVLTAKIKRKAALANTVRTQIEGWRSKEPAGWGDWLSGQPLFDRISSLDGLRAAPTTIAEFIAQESMYAPDINDGVRVNIAPLQRAGILAADVLAGKDLDKAIADRAEWRADERRWVREGKLPQPGWWPDAFAADGHDKTG